MLRRLAVLALVACALASIPPWTAIVGAAAALRVQNTGTGTTTLSTTLTGVVAGDMLSACVYERDGNTISGVSDDVNGAWTQVFNRAAAVARIALFYKANSGAGNPVVTATIGGTAPRDINAAAWSGLPTSVTADTSNSTSNASGTSHPHGSVTPSASALIITCLGVGSDHGGSPTYNAGFTGLNVDAGVGQPNRQLYAYKASHTGTINPTHTTVNSVTSEGGVGVFVESGGGGGGTCTGGLMLLGAGKC